MLGLIIRIVLAILAVGFIAWWLYITWLGLKAFFGLPIEIASMEQDTYRPENY